MVDSYSLWTSSNFRLLHDSLVVLVAGESEWWYGLCRIFLFSLLCNRFMLRQLTILIITKWSSYGPGMFGDIGRSTHSLPSSRSSKRTSISHICPIFLPRQRRLRDHLLVGSQQFVLHSYARPNNIGIHNTVRWSFWTSIETTIRDRLWFCPPGRSALLHNKHLYSLLLVVCNPDFPLQPMRKTPVPPLATP